ncbi:MAG: DUF4105 domain-containing protein [Planctomycetes bacterium]|nr:DUF4105 domain-containing protein [Planctomycetota bacterium]
MGAIAHTLLLFTFRDGKALVLSVEARRRPGEACSVLRGMLRGYPLHCVLGDPRDVLGLRARARGDRILLLSLKPDPVPMEAALRAALLRAGRLAGEGTFCSTLLENCTTTLVRHGSAANPLPWSPRLLLNGRIGEYLQDRGILDTDLPRDRAAEGFRAEERILAADEGDLGTWLRAVTGTGGTAPPPAAVRLPGAAPSRPGCPSRGSSAGRNRVP